MSPALTALEWANRDNQARAFCATLTLPRLSDGEPLDLRLTDSNSKLSGTWDDQYNWNSCISSPATITHQMQQLFNGRSLAAFGDLELALDDNARLGPRGDITWRQAQNDYLWSGGSFLGQVGGPNLAWPSWITSHRGTLGGASMELGRIKVQLLGKAAALETIKIPPDTYTAADGVLPATVGKVKPCCIGPCNNITPVQLSDTVFQAHAYGPMQAFPEIRVADVAVSPASTDPANGKFTLASKPSGTVTCDALGWVRGGVYVYSAAQIIEAILRQWAGATDADLDASAFAAMHAAVPDPLNIYMTSAGDIRSELDSICLGLPLIWMDDRLGRYTLRPFAAPSGQPVLELFDRSAGDPIWGSATCWNVRSAPAPYWWSKCTVHGDRNWSKNGNPLATLPSDRQEWLREEYRARVATGSAPVGNAQVREGDYRTYISALNGCQTHATREIGLHGVPRRVVTLDSLYAALTLDLGDVVRLWSRVGGMDTGWLGMVVERKASLPGQASLRLWG
ncbi:MAG: hypothetical protein V1806_03770 [Pseudomonadota bacterium]